MTSLITRRNDTLIQPGERRILRFTFEQPVNFETLHVQLTALSWGRIVDPQPTVVNRLVDVRAWKTADYEGLLLFTGQHYTFPAAPTCDALDVLVDAKLSFAITRPPYQDTAPIDAIEIAATVLARETVNANVRIRPYADNVEAPLG